MVADIISTITEWITGVLSFVTSAFEGVVSIFYTEADGLTLYGVLLLFGIAVGFVSLGLAFLMKLLRK